MYQMDQLLTLLSIEKAKELRFLPGCPPIVVSDTDQRPMEGPVTTAEEVMGLFRLLANSRQMRELREKKSIRFVYTTHGRLAFVVQARLAAEKLSFEVS